MPDLYMVRYQLPAQGVFDLGKRRGLPLRDADVGYLIHCASGELFRDAAPAPFRFEDLGRGALRILAYSDRAADELERSARDATPDARDRLPAPRVEGRRMPREWKVGGRLAFEVRACPVVRKSSEGPQHRKGAEVDAFLARCWTTEGPVSREAVYTEWLAGELGRRGARLRLTTMRAFRRERFIRRDHAQARTSHVAERPDALLAGELEVTDSAAFSALLRRGIGRHRAFGFGMLLLRHVR